MIQQTKQHQEPRNQCRRRGRQRSKSASLSLANIITTRANSLSTYRMWRTKIWISKIHPQAKGVEARKSKREEPKSIKYHTLKMMLMNTTKTSSRISQLVTMRSRSHWSTPMSRAVRPYYQRSAQWWHSHWLLEAVFTENASLCLAKSFYETFRTYRS